MREEHGNIPFYMGKIYNQWEFAVSLRELRPGSVTAQEGVRRWRWSAGEGIKEGRGHMYVYG